MKKKNIFHIFQYAIRQKSKQQEKNAIQICDAISEKCNIMQFRFLLKRLWLRYRYRNSILVSVPDTNTEFFSHTISSPTGTIRKYHWIGIIPSAMFLPFLVYLLSILLTLYHVISNHVKFIALSLRFLLFFGHFCHLPTFFSHTLTSYIKIP